MANQSPQKKLIWYICSTATVTVAQYEYEVWGKYKEISCTSVIANRDHSLRAQMRNLWEQMTFPLLHRDMSAQQITDKLSLLCQI